MAITIITIIIVIIIICIIQTIKANKASIEYCYTHPFISYFHSLPKQAQISFINSLNKEYQALFQTMLNFEIAPDKEMILIRAFNTWAMHYNVPQFRP